MPNVILTQKQNETPNQGSQNETLNASFGYSYKFEIPPLSRLLDQNPILKIDRTGFLKNLHQAVLVIPEFKRFRNLTEFVIQILAILKSS